MTNEVSSFCNCCFFDDSIIINLGCQVEISKMFCVLYASINLMLQIEKKTLSVLPTKRDLNAKMNCNDKLYIYS